MCQPLSYRIESINQSVIVRFAESSLVFPDQFPGPDSLPADSASSVILDLEKVNHISSAVWGQIIILNKHLRESSRQLRLCHLDDNLAGALDAMKLDQLLGVCDSVQTAIEELKS